MLKTISSTGSVANFEKTEGKFDGNSMVGGNEAINPTKEKNQAKTTKFKILVKSKNHDFPKSRTKKARTSFFTPKARLAFILLRPSFIEAPILYYFDPESHIWIETNISGYAIGGILSQLFSRTKLDKIATKADLGQWHLVAFFLRR